MHFCISKVVYSSQMRVIKITFKTLFLLVGYTKFRKSFHNNHIILKYIEQLNSKTRVLRVPWYYKTRNKYLQIMQTFIPPPGIKPALLASKLLSIN